MADKKKVVYIAGPITGVEEYWKPFEKAEDDLTALGYIPLSPARLPQGMTNEKYMRICFALIDSADAVLVLDGPYSEGVQVEWGYCRYIGKPIVTLRKYADERPRMLGDESGRRNPDDVIYAWLKHDLQEVLK